MIYENKIVQLYSLTQYNYIRVFKFFVVFFSQPHESEISWGEEEKKKHDEAICFQTLIYENDI